MAKIESYDVAQSPLSGSDRLVGTDVSDNNATKNFTINELITFINQNGGYVPYTGATSDVNLGVKGILGNYGVFSLVNASQLNVQNQLYLANSQGAAGQVITSNGPGAAPQWSSASVGAQGVQGPIGPQGPVGPVGPAGLNWQGLWVSGAAYVADDAIGYGGASYFCILATSGTTAPDLDTTHWALLAAQGAQGPAGATGVQGPTGPQGIPGVPGTETLQTVTTAGNTTTTNIITSNTTGSSFLAFNSISSESAYILHELGSGVIGIQNAGAVGAGEIRANLLNDVRFYEFPNANGTFVLRVNGTAPDNAGNVTITANAPYLIYTALLTISGGGVTANVLENTIGDGSGDGINDIAWSSSFGSYLATMTSGPFTLNKTTSVPSLYFASGLNFTFLGQRTSSSVMTFISRRTDDNSTSTGFTSGIFVEIRVYP